MNYNKSTRQRVADINLGLKVSRVTANITNGLALFNIEGGRVLLNLILGEVTTVMETKTTNLKLTSDPDTGTTTDLCANLDMTAAEAGSLLTISGVVATPLQIGKSGSVIGQLFSIPVAAGAIKAVVGATHTGSIKFDLWYVPLDEGAYIEAA